MAGMLPWQTYRRNPSGTLTTTFHHPRDDRRWSLSYLPEEPIPIVESKCEIVHPRPKRFWVLTQQDVAQMEHKVNTDEDEREARTRAQAIAAGEIFDRSDDDEIVVIPQRRSTYATTRAPLAAIKPPHAPGYAWSTRRGHP
ncbi:SubName: Full=Uncharacterized protein {ECO:0000313/EMBL:CCA69790.1} [Serendipita indica DSM 11827]|nr:SubName: Full=Uncharacterized protein {ECO:0000313/EMBL:CCA69790.1} [Serendipita indica DSM 11827]